MQIRKTCISDTVMFFKFQKGILTSGPYKKVS